MLFGLARTSAGPAALLLNLESVLTLGLAWMAFREHVDRRLLIDAAAIVVGALVLSAAPGTQTAPGGLAGAAGPMLIAGACLCWAIDNNLTRHVSSADPTQIAMVKGLVAGTVNTVIAAATGALWPVPPVVAAAALLGFVG